MVVGQGSYKQKTLSVTQNIGRIIGMVVGEGGRSTGVLLYEGFYNIVVNHPAIVWEIPHFGVFPAFWRISRIPAFFRELPAFLPLFSETNFRKIAIICGPRKTFLCIILVSR